MITNDVCYYNLVYGCDNDIQRMFRKHHYHVSRSSVSNHRMFRWRCEHRYMSLTYAYIYIFATARNRPAIFTWRQDHRVGASSDLINSSNTRADGAADVPWRQHTKLPSMHAHDRTGPVYGGRISNRAGARQTIVSAVWSAACCGQPRVTGSGACRVAWSVTPLV